MKRLFIYYSFTGNGDLVANTLSKYNIDIRKVETKHKLPKIFFFQMMVGGFRGLTKHKDRLYEYDKDVSDYDEIIIGSPIWFDRVSSPINRVIDDLNLTGKKVSFVFYSGSGEATEASTRVKDLFKNPYILILQQPNKNSSELDKLKVFKKEI